MSVTNATDIKEMRSQYKEIALCVIFEDAVVRLSQGATEVFTLYLVGSTGQVTRTNSMVVLVSLLRAGLHAVTPIHP